MFKSLSSAFFDDCLTSLPPASQQEVFLCALASTSGKRLSEVRKSAEKAYSDSNFSSFYDFLYVAWENAYSGEKLSWLQL